MAKNGTIEVNFVDQSYTVPMTLERCLDIEDAIPGGVLMATRNMEDGVIPITMRSAVGVLRVAIKDQEPDFDSMAAGAGLAEITRAVTPILLRLVFGASNPETVEGEQEEKAPGKPKKRRTSAKSG